ARDERTLRIQASSPTGRQPGGSTQGAPGQNELTDLIGPEPAATALSPRASQILHTPHRDVCTRSRLTLAERGWLRDDVRDASRALLRSDAAAALIGGSCAIAA